MKTTEEIYSEMAAAFSAATGQTAGPAGDLAVRLHAVAAQICALYAQTDWTTRQCFPQTAEAEFLDMHAALRGITRRAAAYAQGSIRFFVDTAAGSDLSIPEGTICLTAALVRFETTEAALLPAGELYIDVPARALGAGTAGNTGAGTILSMSLAPVGISRCSNPAAFAGGSDTESDGALRERVIETFKRLPNGANAAFYEQGALSFPEVAAAAVIPRNRGIGTVDVVAATRTGMPDSALLEKLRTHFAAKREIAVDVQVLAPTEKTVDLIIELEAEEGRNFAAVRTAAETALRNYFTGALLGKHVLLARLGEVLFGTDGVANYRIAAPTGDIAVRQNELPRLGSLTLSEMGAA